MRGISFAVGLLLLIITGYYSWQSADQSLTTTNQVRTRVDSGNPATSNDSATISSTVDDKSVTESQGQLQQEARQYVAEITTHDKGTVVVDSADDFVNRNEPISLFANKNFESRTLEQLKREIKPDAPLTIIRKQEQVELISSKELLADSGGNLYQRIKVLTGGKVETRPVGEIIKAHADPDSPISIIRNTENLEVTTLRELWNNDMLSANETIKLIREPYRLQTTTVNELLMGEETVVEHSIFYVRHIISDDAQGLWGIVHNGLVKNFASGIAIRRDQEIEKYQVDIPTNADERLDDDSSSFLGRMIDRKTRESYVYNHERRFIARNPDIVYPGQDVVIIGFTPEELYEIYEHFVTRSESRS